jgi:hypothetical protein
MRITALAPLSRQYWIVGMAPSMRAVLVMTDGSFLSWGTLKSTRMRTRLPLTSTSLIETLQREARSAARAAAGAEACEASSAVCVSQFLGAYLLVQAHDSGAGVGDTSAGRCCARGLGGGVSVLGCLCMAVEHELRSQHRFDASTAPLRRP